MLFKCSSSLLIALLSAAICSAACVEQRSSANMGDVSVIDSAGYVTAPQACTPGQAAGLWEDLEEHVAGFPELCFGAHLTFNFTQALAKQPPTITRAEILNFSVATGLLQVAYHYGEQDLCRKTLWNDFGPRLGLQLADLVQAGLLTTRLPLPPSSTLWASYDADLVDIQSQCVAAISSSQCLAPGQALGQPHVILRGLPHTP